VHRSTPPTDPIRGHNPDHALDALFVNTPLRDYAQRPRVNDFTLPVLGVDYIEPTVEEVRAALVELSRSEYVRRAA